MPSASWMPMNDVTLVDKEPASTPASASAWETRESKNAWKSQAPVPLVARVDSCSPSAGNTTTPVTVASRTP